MKKKISILSPCYNEETNVEACYAAVKEVMETHLPGYEYEHIFADNASSDDTVSVLRRIADADTRVKVIVNARNYGPFRSTFNALRVATGDAVLVLLPVDLQDPPELIPDFVSKWEEGYKIVYGQRVDRREGVIMRNVRKVYYRTLQRFADIDIPVDTAEFQLIDKRVHQELLKADDHYPYIRGLIADIGFADASIAIPYTWRERHSGRSKNRLYHLVDQGMNGVVSFTSAPLRLVAFAGIFIALMSFLYGLIQLTIIVFIGSTSPAGIPTLIVALFFFSGVQLFVIGLLGEYVAAIHQQVRRGGRVVERERINL